MDVNSVFQKHGKDWTKKEVEMVFGWLFESMIDELVRFAYRFTKSLEMAMDAVQESMCKALRGLATYDPSAYRGSKQQPFQNWLYTILGRVSMQMARKEKVLVSLEEGLDEQLTVVSADDGTIDTDKEKLELLFKYIEKLDPKYKEAIELCVLKEMPQLDAARASQWPCSEGAMKVRKHRAMQQLSQLVSKGGRNA